MSTDTYTYFKQWRLDREAGKGPRLVPSGPSIDHIRSLLDAGASGRAIAAAAGVSAEGVSRLLTRPQPTVQVATERRILGVTMEAIARRKNPAGFVPAIGARRRIQALLALGWTHKLITEHMTGVGQISHVALHQRGNWIARATHDAVVTAYEALCMTPGPSAISRRRAEARGYAPPLAWDEGKIDDPEATPDLGQTGRGVGRPGFDLDEWALLVRSGEDPERAAERCGVKLSTASKAALRAGRRDLYLLAERAVGEKRRAA